MQLNAQRQLTQQDALAHCVQAINGVGFAQKLINYIALLVEFDCAVVLACRANKHPVYLFDSIDKQRELLFQRYLTNSYVNDPFYTELVNKAEEGVFRLADITSYQNELAFKVYQQQFYTRTGWADELSICINIGNGRSIMIYLGLLTQMQCFSASHKQQLIAHFNLIKALCSQHWGSQLLLLNQFSSTTTGQLIEGALTSFANQQLTEREHQVACLLVQGCDSADIALQLGITLGTVKNHRKRIYAQLNVASLSEFFRLFLNHLITIK
ncbi:LuxR C-terminal-related transcriptional regulator [Pseudoalteromonas sp.]|uniref:LuxR C-terminal-related transcriptional regulator n=1 Tax=Pseudoalteromonas sp. TaxID=53249 RepID=UPI001BCBA6F6|nr:LuxR C-terminal-related transcriptional regulator [Pseudoalteromonas sp.]